MRSKRKEHFRAPATLVYASMFPFDCAFIISPSTSALPLISLKATWTPTSFSAISDSLSITKSRTSFHPRLRAPYRMQHATLHLISFVNFTTDLLYGACAHTQYWPSLYPVSSHSTSCTPHYHPFLSFTLIIGRARQSLPRSSDRRTSTSRSTRFSFLQ